MGVMRILDPTPAEGSDLADPQPDHSSPAIPFPGPMRVLECCHNALQLYGRGEAAAWPRRESWSPEADLELFMPARLGDWEGFKIIRERPSAEPGRLGTRTAWMVVRHPPTHRAWRLPADEITDARTGAAGILAAAYLSPAEVREASVIGSGRVAHSIAAYFGTIRKSPILSRLEGLRSISIYSQTPARRSDFVGLLQSTLDIPVREAISVRDAVQSAGVVLIAVASPAPVIEMDDLAPGAHLSALSGSPFSAALGDTVLLGSDVVVVDQMEQCLRSGEMRALQEDGRIQSVRFARLDGRPAHLGDASIGKIPRQDGKNSLAYLSGIALLDLAVGVEWVHEVQQASDETRASVRNTAGQEEQILQEIDLWQPIP